MLSGIYLIVNILNNKVYIGSSCNTRNRWRLHVNQLNNNKHHSIILQRAWNKYSSEQFVFTIFENCEPDQLLIREQYWIDILKPEYNICKTAGSPLGHKHTKEFRENISKRLIGNTYTLGHKASALTKAKMSKARLGKKLPPFSDAHRKNISLARIGITHKLKEFCKNGHKYTNENTSYRKVGTKHCRRCKACRKLSETEPL